MKYGSEMEYFIGCFLMQGLLCGFGVYAISKEHLPRDSAGGGKYWLHTQTLPVLVEYGGS